MINLFLSYAFAVEMNMRSIEVLNVIESPKSCVATIVTPQWQSSEGGEVCSVVGMKVVEKENEFSKFKSIKNKLKNADLFCSYKIVCQSVKTN